jgi:hypothetical protein
MQYWFICGNVCYVVQFSHNSSSSFGSFTRSDPPSICYSHVTMCLFVGTVMFIACVMCEATAFDPEVGAVRERWNVDWETGF